MGTFEHGIDLQVQALHLGPAGLWAAPGAGLALLPPAGAPRVLSAVHGLLSSRLYALAAAGERLSVGTLAGLSVVVGERVAEGHGAGALDAGWVSALHRCGDDLYSGTYGGGLAALRGAAGGAQPPARLPGPALRVPVNQGALLCDGDVLWSGTLERGLLRHGLRTGAVRALAPHLLPARSVTALWREPRPGAPLWVGTEAGLLVLAVDRAPFDDPAR